MKNSPSPKKKDQEIENPELKKKISSIYSQVDYKKLSFQDIVAQNKKILSVLKGLQQKLTEFISTVQTKRLFNFKQGKQHGTQLTEQYKILQEQINNKKKLIAALKSDQQTTDKRIQKINGGLQSKTNERKFEIEKKISQLKQWIKKTKIEEHETEKVLGSHQDKNDYLGCTQHDRLQQELRAYSIKYVRLMDSYNKSVEKLAISSSIKEIPDDFQIPQEIFNEDIEKRQAQQYKQYQSIVKLCTILEKRNDSEHNKAHRIYTERLKQLERIISSLGQIDRMIAQRQGQLLQSRKSIQIVKTHMSKGDIMNLPELPNISRRTLGSVSQMSRGKSYTSIKPKISTRQRQFSIARLQPAYGSTKG